jgi:environmental stress-induced protein Ves
MKIIRFAELKAIPWKNGLGITREIAVQPGGATMDDFLWRVSVADVDTASPFSRFPGIDRTIVLLEGDGFTMTLGGERRHALTTACVPFAFAGEAAVEVVLAGGATRDFNLMVRRDAGRGVIDVMRGPMTLTLDSDAALVYLARGEAHIDGTASPPVRAGDSVRGVGEITLAADATALLVRVRPAVD